MCLVGVSHDEGSSSFAAMGLSNDGKLVFNDTEGGGRGGGRTGLCLRGGGGGGAYKAVPKGGGGGGVQGCA